MRSTLWSRPLRLWALALAVGPVCFACRGHVADDKPNAAETIAECQNYVTAFRACQSSLGDAARDVAEGYAASMERAFASAGDEPARARLRESCAAGLERLKAACR